MAVIKRLVRRLAIAALCVLIGGKLMAGQAQALDIEAHRGGRALLPENTLAAFANALSMGVTTLELDLGVTRDGVIVISHERSLNPDLARDEDGHYVAPPGTPLIRLTLEELKKFDVGQIRPGSRYAAQFPEQKPVPGARIPTLQELIGLVRRSGDSRVRLNIETKIDPTNRRIHSASSRCCWTCCGRKLSRIESWCNRSTGGRCSSCRSWRRKSQPCT
jgi:glycerophosphoryl diester phosphodiesterase